MVREKVFVHNNAQIMERKMWQFILGSTGFILYFIYDINSVRMKNAVLQKFFAAGSILVVVSLIAELYAAWGSCHRKIGLYGRYVWIVPPSWCFMVCRSIFVHVGNGRWMETWDLFFTYDFLELSVYYFSGSVDIPTDIF